MSGYNNKRAQPLSLEKSTQVVFQTKTITNHKNTKISDTRVNATASITTTTTTTKVKAPASTASTATIKATASTIANAPLPASLKTTTYASTIAKTITTTKISYSNSHKGTNTTANTITNSHPSYNSSLSTLSGSSDRHENDIMSKIYRSLVGDVYEEEYEQTLMEVCDSYGISQDNWYAMAEAEDIIIDKRRIAAGLTPIYSSLYREPVILNYSSAKKKNVDSDSDDQSDEDSEESDDYNNNDKLLPVPIALIKQSCANDTKTWISETVAIIKTAGDFWSVIKQLNNNSTESAFSRSINSDHMANTIFSNLHTGKIQAQPEIKKLITNYNSIHPVWCFCKVPNNTTNGTQIDIPFIRNKDGHAINDVNINLKDIPIRDIQNQDIKLINSDFSDGYIPNIVFSFIVGKFPSPICAVVFNKTIAVCRGRSSSNSYNLGYRLRLLAEKVDSSILIECEQFMRNDFIGNNGLPWDYTKFIVNMSDHSKKSNS